MSLKFYFYVYAWSKKYLLENIHNMNIMTMSCIIFTDSFQLKFLFKSFSNMNNNKTTPLKVVV